MGNLNLLLLSKVLLKRLKKKDIVVLDVRTIHEYVGAHIDGAINMPYDELDYFIKEIISWDKPVLVCSANGRRSHIAATFLKKHGVEALDGGDWEYLDALIKSK